MGEQGSWLFGGVGRTLAEGVEKLGDERSAGVTGASLASPSSMSGRYLA